MPLLEDKLVCFGSLQFHFSKQSQRSLWNSNLQISWSRLKIPEKSINTTSSKTEIQGIVLQLPVQNYFTGSSIFFIYLFQKNASHLFSLVFLEKQILINIEATHF